MTIWDWINRYSESQIERELALDSMFVDDLDAEVMANEVTSDRKSCRFEVYGEPYRLILDGNDTRLEELTVAA